jgi:hypothetical protein
MGSKTKHYQPKYQIQIPSRPPGDYENYSADDILYCLELCNDEEIGPHFFIQNFCKIYDNTSRAWIPFLLWPAQVDALEEIRRNRFIAILKSRQVGLSWLVICFILWHALFRASILGLLFSKREDEAIELLDFRYKGIYWHLPSWMRLKETSLDSKKDWAVSNGSRVKASSTGGADSYAASIALVDEADLVYQSKRSLQDFLADLEPTVESAGGWIILISRSDKSRPASTFKKIFKAASQGVGKYAAVFIPWYARPDRTDEWYDEKVETAIARTGSNDEVLEQYPETPEDALAPPTLGRRFPSQWIAQCYVPQQTVNLATVQSDKKELRSIAASIPHQNLRIYREPQVGSTYVACVDGAEGGQGADDSACTIFDWETGEEVATLFGRIETSPFAQYIYNLAMYYNRAKIICERNSIGSTLILWWQTNASEITLMKGPDSTPESPKIGWLNNVKWKPLMWSKTADYLRDQKVILHTQKTMLQIADIDAIKLRASEGNNDDLAVTIGLFCAAKEILSRNFVFEFLSIT